MLFLVYSVNNFERWYEFVEVFLSHLVNKRKKVFVIIHEFIFWITFFPMYLILSAVAINNGFGITFIN